MGSGPAPGQPCPVQLLCPEEAVALSMQEGGGSRHSLEETPIPREQQGQDGAGNLSATSWGGEEKS